MSLFPSSSQTSPPNGRTNPPTQGGGLFGNTTNQGSPAQEAQQGATRGLFGSQAALVPTHGGLFGNTTNQGSPNQRAQQGTTGGLFGNTNSSSNKPNGLFGQPSAGSLFANSSSTLNQSPFGQQAGGGGLFGNKQPSNSQGGLFGGNSNPSNQIGEQSASPNKFATQLITSPSKAVEGISAAQNDSVNQEINNKPQEIWRGESTLYVANIKQLFLEKEFSDIIFDVQGEEFYGHRNLLAIRCKSFNEKFKEKQVGSEILRVQIIDMAPEVFRALLEFVYCNEIRLTENLALDLIKVANQYAFPELKEVCGTFLSKSLALENFAKLADIAENEQVYGLRNAILDYVVANFNQVKQREDHNSLPKSILWDLICRLQQKK